MKNFIRYLYEYEQGKRIRNIGFVKVEQRDESCMIHIHGKGLKQVKGEELELYLFYVDGKRCIGMLQGVIEHADHVIHYRLDYSPDDVGGKTRYQNIEGIILLAGGNKKFAAVWDDMPVNVDEMIIKKDFAMEPEEEKETDEEANRAEEQIPMSEEVSDQGDGQDEPEAQEEAEPQTQEIAEKPKQAGSTEETPQVPEPESGVLVPEEIGAQQVKNCRCVKPRCRKITRQEIAELPRCEWKLANNSFLLHGYHNYRHLLLIEEGDICFLGVPGVFHEREQAAARAFGFNQFHRIEKDEVELSKAEYNQNDDFGYWCRQVQLKSI